MFRVDNDMREYEVATIFVRDIAIKFVGAPGLLIAKKTVICKVKR